MHPLGRAQQPEARALLDVPAGPRAAEVEAKHNQVTNFSPHRRIGMTTLRFRARYPVQGSLSEVDGQWPQQISPKQR